VQHPTAKEFDPNIRLKIIGLQPLLIKHLILLVKTAEKLLTRDLTKFKTTYQKIVLLMPSSKRVFKLRLNFNINS
jgi:hypothetical protein